MPDASATRFEHHVYACLVFGVVGDAMGTATENLEPEEIERRLGWVDKLEGDGTDDTIMRNLLIDALVATDGYADADSWAAEWERHRAAIFGEKVGRFFPSVLHAVAKLRHGYTPRTLAIGNMPSSSSAMSIAPVGIVNAGNPRAAAAQAMEVASLIHLAEVGFCQDGAAAIAAAVAVALTPGATIDSVLRAAVGAIKPWSGAEMRGLIERSLALAAQRPGYKEFRRAYHGAFRRQIPCDSRETVPAALALVRIANGDPWQAAVLSANFGRDADTIGCMAAAVCGALSGVSAENQGRIAQLPGDALVRERSLAERLIAVRRRRIAIERAALDAPI